jgi:hypothetical protein
MELGHEVAKVDNAERALRAYAYLTASFRTQEQVVDVFDCLTPFLSAAIKEQNDRPVDIQSIVERVKRYGLDVPFYVVEQLLPRLAKQGIIEWNAVAKAFIPCNSGGGVDDFPALPDSFDAIEPALATYAKSRGISKPPLSVSWSEALIGFLKESYSGRNIRAIQAQGVIVADTPEIESFIVASFLREIAYADSELFDHVVRIYIGVLIEDFITNVQALQQSTDYSRLHIYYDTSILLRALGTSGRILHEATLQMHHTLQALGAKTYYLGHTSTEVENILTTLAAAYERGQEIYNETADALLDGEITIGQIRDLAGTYESRLAKLNVFPLPYDYSVRKNEEYYQVDEIAFSEALKSAALKRERVYSVQNALNDAGAVAVILRLRRGRSAKDIGKSHAIFVSRNSLLQRVARQFAIKNTDHYDEGSIPPVLTTGQITTASWLAEGRTLEPAKVSKELLAACYSAVQPSAEWADEFAHALEEFRKENPDVISDRADALLFLQSARHAARDASFNDPTILKKINTAEMFRKAAEDARRVEEERAAAAAAEHENQLRRDEERAAAYEAEKSELARSLQEQHEATLAASVEAASSDAFMRAKAEAEERADRKAGRLGSFVVNLVRLPFALLAAYLIVFVNDIGEPGSAYRWLAIAFCLAITALAICDLVGMPFARRFFDSVRQRLARAFKPLFL